ncbi:MAG: hypothetical protein K9L78_04195 [Victivallales bacterium]|nr:hypothetical protein [Victivallales bacterium]
MSNKLVSYNKFILVSIVCIMVFFTNVLYAEETYQFKNFNWNDGNKSVKKKLQEQDFNIRFSSTDKYFKIQEALVIDVPYLSNIQDKLNKLREFNVDLPKSNTFQSYEGTGPEDDITSYYHFYIYNKLDKLVACNVRIRKEYRSRVHNSLKEKYGSPNVSNDNYIIWKNENQLLASLVNGREVVYLNKTNLNHAVKEMRKGLEAKAQNREDKLENIFTNKEKGKLSFYAINWNTERQKLAESLSDNDFHIRDSEKTNYYDVSTFTEGHALLEKFNDKSNKYETNDKYVIKHSGFYEGNVIPVGSISFYYSSMNNKLLYMIVEINRDSQKNIVNIFNNNFTGHDYSVGKYWNKDNVYVFKCSNRLFYINKKHTNSHFNQLKKVKSKESSDEKEKIDNSI